MEIREFTNIVQPKIAIAEDLQVADFQENPVFPKMINLGKLEAKNGDILPALFPITQTNGICFLSNNENKVAITNALQQLALRLALSFPAGMCKFTFIDPTGLGQNFKFLSNLNSKIIGSKILTETKEIERAINELKSNTTNVIQKILGYKYHTLEEYNRTAGDLAEPYHFLFLANCPRKLTRENCEQLLSLLESGYKAGIFVIMNLDTTFKPKSDYDINPFQFLKLMPIIYQIGNVFYTKNFGYESYFNTKFKFYLNTKIPTQLDDIVTKINTVIGKTKRAEVNLSNSLTMDSLWKASAGEKLVIPIGKMNQSELQNIVLGTNDHHGLIGGTTGMGKTVLLHNIICNAAWLYAPDELQFVLMDYKEGTEFKPYENLPHIKVLSINSEREFGLSVFEYLKGEIERRGELFKKYNVAKLSAYRTVAQQKMPRILIIVDEFQVLISNTDKISKQVIELMDDIAKRGRSFGINMFLCTQTLGEVMIKGSTLSQVGLRIAMKLHSNDCHKILGPDNNLPIYFDKPGEAVYNAKNGLSEGNVKFQVGYMSDDTMKEIIKKLQSFIKKADLHKQFIFDGTISADIQSNSVLNDKINNNAFVHNDHFMDVFIGEPAYLDEKHTRFVIRKQNESNVLLVGQDIPAALSIIYHSFWQLIKQSSVDSKFYILDLFNVDSGFKGKLNQLQNFSNNIVIKSRDIEIESIVNDIAAELTRRIQTETQNTQIVLAILDIQKARVLRKQGFSPSKVAEKLNGILKDGSAYGIHTFIHAASYTGLLDAVDTKMLSEFETRIALNGGDSLKILGNTYMEGSLKNNGIGFIKSPYTKYEQDKVKIYKL